MKPVVRKFLAVMALVYALNICSTTVAAGEQIPEELDRWRSWVLHGHEEKLCPVNFNDGSVVRCQWPSRLELSVSDEGGHFEQRWQLFAPGWVALPGDADAWPLSVAVDGSSTAVMNRGGIASIYLLPGSHRINGLFAWPRMPDMIRVPPAVGLLSLVVDGRKIHTPLVDDQGRLWLSERQSATVQQTERHVVRIFRLIDDSIPMRITTAVRLEVSGPSREIRIESVLMKNTLPMHVQSPLPLLIDTDGSLLVQARPGRWELRVVARLPEAVHKLTYGQAPYGDEIWSFQPRHHLRMVEISGAERVEPGQTEMPPEWRRMPAYLIKSGSVLILKEIRRGDPRPAPNRLTLQRRLWLDFGGEGFTVQDRISGRLSRQWWLAVTPPMTLGRVAIDGRDQVISAQGGERTAGVQLRRGTLDLLAESRLAKRTISFPAVGWDHDFDDVIATLNLPPGWRLLAASGVDRASDTWFQRWTLLDFFLALMIALAVFKLRDWRWGLLALATMALTFHEAGAPRLVWLNILAVLALQPMLPSGWIKRMVTLWGFCAMGTLVVLAVPFMANQIRWGVYPQLAPHHTFSAFQEARVPVGSDDDAVMSLPPARPEPVDKGAATEMFKAGSGPREDRSLQPEWSHDPDALIPTGPGLPDWKWHAVDMEWNGPVAKDQQVRFYLLSPWANLVLALLRVALMALLIWGLFDWRPWLSKIRQAVASGGATLVIVALLAGVPAAPARASEVGFPPPELLDALRQRLLAPADCLPYCADISRLELAVAGDELQILLKAHAATTTAVPLPANRSSWVPEQILLDNAPISGLARDDGGLLWAVVPRGLHTIVMLGSVAQSETVQIPLPLKPHAAAYTADGWSATGILPDGTVGSSIQLTRIQPTHARTKTAVDKTALPPFLHVTRHLQLGTHWQVDTTIERVSPVGVPVVASVPLLAKESLTTAGLHVEQGHALINMSPEQTLVRFSSTLQVGPKIELTAPRAVPWTESWVLNVSPIWRCEFSGLNAIHYQDETAHWRPQWKPWPGETLSIQISRPEALGGQTVTIEQVRLIQTPGRRHSQNELALTIRTSHGGQHTIELPSRANLQSVQIDKKSLPVQQDGQWVTFPLQPGAQNVVVAWNSLTPFRLLHRTPEIKIGEAAVNAKVRMNMPAKRWILLSGGPRWGPAVLFWSYLAVVALAAFGLSRVSITPLKGWQWLLLGLGLTQVPVVMSLFVVGWLLAMGLKGRQSAPEHWLAFNAMQFGMIVLTLFALLCLFAAIHAGLIGQPEMQIAGNGSSEAMLNWTQDRIATVLPRPWVVSLPVWVYRCLMLAWSLWLALSLLAWLKWGWQCYAKDGLWRKKPPKPKKGGAAA
ncbi:MAG: hypothetical protein PVI89_03260 [Desulfobacteraceae bacterium]|jgi:hypothetical protein